MMARPAGPGSEYKGFRSGSSSGFGWGSGVGLTATEAALLLYAEEEVRTLENDLE
ncbi:MAG: hypothetical protein WCB18_02635 [Thermoplasmata archaeon]